MNECRKETRFLHKMLIRAIWQTIFGTCFFRSKKNQSEILFEMSRNGHSVLMRLYS